MQQQRNYECGYCGQGFVHEERFMAHKCKRMKRQEVFNTPVGQAAWFYYQEWMKASNKKVSKSKSFIQSKYFNSFVRFAEFVKKTQMPKPELFIWLMKQKDMSPTIWTNDQVYSQYLEFLDRKGDPHQLAQITINTLFKISDAAECDVSNIFSVLTANEVIQLLRQRRMSPWILLLSKKFTEFYCNNVSSEERIIIESIIRPEYWAEKFKNNPQIVNTMRQYISELGL